MRKSLLFCTFLGLVCFQETSAQYYYKDIISNNQLILEYKQLKSLKVRNVMVHSLEADGSNSPGFYCEKKINKNFSEIATYTKSNITGKSVLTTTFNTLGLITNSVDSSELAVSHSDYFYNDKNKLARIKITSYSNDDDFSTKMNEERFYTYDKDSLLTRLLVVKNGKDTTNIDFLKDENGNIIDEIETQPQGHHYYYYYDTNNRLTDIVRYNTFKGRLLPDFMFEYNDYGQMSQMISTEEGPNSNYFLWKYFYNDNGLRIIEKCFSKEKVLLGSFEYEYQ